MGQKHIYLLGGILALYVGDSAWSRSTEERVPSGPRTIQNMGPDNIPSRRAPSGVVDTPPPPIPIHGMRPPSGVMDTPPPPVPIHGMRPPPENASEQPVPEAYRTIPERRIDW